MSNIQVVRHELSNIDFSSPTTNIDPDTGEIILVCDSNVSLKNINKIALLYYAYFDDSGNLVNYEPVIPANNYIVHLKLNKDLEDTNHITNGLLLYFSKLLDWEITWKTFPIRDSSRATKMYKVFLEKAAKSKEAETKLAPSTARNYMAAVKKMYIHYLSKGFKFENPPMEYEELKINVKAPESSMRSYRRLSIQSTDLRLNLPRVCDEDRERPLIALSDKEWETVRDYIAGKKKVLKNQGENIFQEIPIPKEYSYMCYVMRYVGLRREEVATLRENHVRMPTAQELELGEVQVYIGPDQYVDTKGGSPRYVKFPSLLIKILYQYTKTDRYIKRRNKFKPQFKDEPPYLFMKSNGAKFNNNTLNCRWSEIRNTIQMEFGTEFKHKQHNLRATFAVSKLKAFLNAGYKQGDAIEKLKKELGHLDSNTTESYINQATGAKSSHQLSEEVTDYLFNYYKDMFEV